MPNLAVIGTVEVGYKHHNGMCKQRRNERSVVHTELSLELTSGRNKCHGTSSKRNKEDSNVCGDDDELHVWTCVGIVRVRFKRSGWIGRPVGPMKTSEQSLKMEMRRISED